MKFEISAARREAQGTGASRRLRRMGKVPGIVYGGAEAPVNIQLDHKDLFQNLRNEKFHASILTLDLAGSKQQVLLRAVNMHPFKLLVQHVDFQRVSKDKKIHVAVPLHFVNAEIAPGVKTGGGVVQQAMNAIDIQCLPDDLPAYIEVDLKDLELNHTLHVMELAMPRGVEPVARLKLENSAVVSIHVPKEIVVEEEAAAPVTEIIGEVPAEGEAAAEGAEGEKKEGAAAEKKEPAAAEKKEPAKKGKE